VFRRSTSPAARLERLAREEDKSLAVFRKAAEAQAHLAQTYREVGDHANAVAEHHKVVAGTAHVKAYDAERKATQLSSLFS
jgi:hypothetical protein